MADGMITVGLYNAANLSCSDNFGNALVSTFSPAQCPFVLGPISAEVYPYKIRYRTDSAWVGGDIHVKFTVDGNVLFSQTLTSAMITASDGVRTDWQIVNWPLHSMISMSVGPSCEDERTYADTYRITIQGTSKLGNPVTIVQDYNFSGGGEFWLEDHEANLKGWYSIERVAIRALGSNVTCKNGVIQLIVREYTVPTSYEGAALGASGGFSEDVTFATAVFRSCQLYADISYWLYCSVS